MAKRSKSPNKKEQKLLDEMRDKFQRVVDYESENRRMAYDDLLFANGDQWPEELRSMREAEQRPCLTINRCASFIDQVVGDQRQNRPSIKVRAVDDKSDPKTAEILQGLIRHIEYDSCAELAYDHAFEYSVSCGLGAFRVLTEYVDEESFEQKIVIKPIYNPFSVYWDQYAKEPDKSDIEWAIVSEWVSKETFKKLYPGVEPVDTLTSAMELDLDNWDDAESTRVAEYWYKEYEEKEFVQIATGEIIDIAEMDVVGEVEIVSTKKVKIPKVMWIKTNGSHVLEGPTEFPGKFIPIIPVLGKLTNCDGSRYHRGLIHFSKDAQRMYNYMRSSATESVSRSPKTPFLVTPKHIENFEEYWNTMNLYNRPYLPFNPDPSGVSPQRIDAVPVPQGYVNEGMQAIDDLKATTGIYDAALGSRGNETSGRAILARQKESDTATFAFIDNLSRSITFLGKIIVDLIPNVYDSQRVLRIMGEDSSEKSVEVNKPEWDYAENMWVILNDLTVGKYDVRVDVGPSYTTQRLEAAASMLDFIQAVPNVGAMTGDLIAESMDWPKADEFAKRIKKSLPPELTADEDDEQEGPTPQQQMQMQQAQQAQQMAQQQMAMQQQQQQLAVQMQQMNAEVKQVESQAKIVKAQADVQKAQLGVQKEQVQLEQEVLQTEQEKQKANLDQLEMDRGVRDYINRQVAHAIQAMVGNKPV